MSFDDAKPFARDKSGELGGVGGVRATLISGMHGRSNFVMSTPPSILVARLLPFCESKKHHR